MKRIAIFASGTGSNTDAIATFLKGDASVEIGLVISSKSDAGVLQVADSHGIEWVVLQKTDFQDEQVVLELLKGFEIDVLILAGWLLLIPDYLIKVYQGRILNIHPALLPKYGGKGMYGKHVHKAVRDAGEKESGITIHEVNERYDEGRIVLQARVSISEHDDAQAIEAKVRALEVAHYPKAIKNFVDSIF